MQIHNINKHAVSVPKAVLSSSVINSLLLGQIRPSGGHWHDAQLQTMWIQMEWIHISSLWYTLTDGSSSTKYNKLAGILVSHERSTTEFTVATRMLTLCKTQEPHSLCAGKDSQTVNTTWKSYLRVLVLKKYSLFVCLSRPCNYLSTSLCFPGMLIIKHLTVNRH